MNCVILQPSYVPWRGYFHQIRKADVFVFYDDVQYDKHGWRNRNRVKTPAGTKWLSIPVFAGGAVSGHLPIKDVRICWDKPWNRKHLATLMHSYHQAPIFRHYVSLIEDIYSRHDDLLVEFTIACTIRLAREMGLHDVLFLRSSELRIAGGRTRRLVDIVKAVGADRYVSGPSAADYLEEKCFADAGIEVEYMKYNYPEYPQLYPPFDPNVSILDLLFMTGPDASGVIWGAGARETPVKLSAGASSMGQP